MMGRQQVIARIQASSRLASASTSALALAVLACFAAAIALSAPPALAAECPNEQLRQESRLNPATGRPYSSELPDCRAYEMVSPSFKAGHEVRPPALFFEGPLAFPVAPDGDAAGFYSIGSFAEPENSVVNDFTPFSSYVSQRGETEWETHQALAPAKYVFHPFSEGLIIDLSPDLRTVEVSCGFTQGFEGVTCAARKQGGSWSLGTPIYPFAFGFSGEGQNEGYIGGSLDLSRVFIEPGKRLRSTDSPVPFGSIYEISGVGTGSSQLRLVNVSNNGTELEQTNSFEVVPAMVGDSGDQFFNGTGYHAISDSGMAVFFTATPLGGVQTVFARIHCKAESATCREDNEGDVQGEKSHELLETVAISNPSPSQCQPSCEKPAEKPGIFQGASADGSRVFFTTQQELLPGDTDETYDLYEYDFKKREEGKNPLTLISEGTPEARKALSEAEKGAEVEGVSRTSSDGSHVYFVAKGVLTTTPNGNGEHAEAGQSNLYGYDTETNELKFVARVNASSVAGGDEVSSDTERHAQTTPDGRQLVFSTPGPLENTGDTNGSAQAVYRYDFQTGELTWVSHPASGFASLNEKKDALVTPLLGAAKFQGLESSPGATQASSEDWSRQISGEAEREPDGIYKTHPGTREYADRYDAETILFSTSEQLQTGAKSNGPQVYEWHNGTVGMVSAGVQYSTPLRLTAPPPVGMSASGSDIFFMTSTQLVGQDSDALVDLYDARKNGGFPAPTEGRSCSGEPCQGTPVSPEPFGSAQSSNTNAEGNLTSQGGGTLGFEISKPKPTTAQRLATALKACRKKRSKKQRVACERQANKTYGAKAKAKKTKARKSERRGK